MIQYFLQKQAGLTSDGNWQFCNTTRGTFEDCPISNYNLTSGDEFFLTVQNPSNIDQKVGVISVPNGHFKVD
jgi:hypothetical protein